MKRSLACALVVAGALGLPIPVALAEPRLQGVMTPAPDGTSVYYVESGTVGDAALRAELAGAIAGDSPAADAGPGDGHVSGCVDGGGALIEGDGCAADSRIADGHERILELHGARIALMSAIDPTYATT
ncbi:MAG: hypothetical protein D6689_08265 [Deltaproteobacteria bacterium]|nr:MAG: hypothetical protein D6689_08265 [Deltaproteobacteria bacterium]